MASAPTEIKPDFPFAFPSYDDWLEIARKELDGANPTEKLTIHKGDLEIQPFYTAPKNEIESKPLLKPSPNPYNGSRCWVNTPKITVTDESKANENALDYLNSGAEGILFDCESPDIKITSLLKNISLTDCSVSFLAHPSSAKWLKEYHHYVKNNFAKNEIKGNHFWKVNPENQEGLKSDFSDWPLFYSLGIVVIPNDVASEEIAQSLQRAVKLIQEWSANNIDTTSIINQISFSVPVGTDFFLAIAKLKALRNLWNQVKGAYNVSVNKALHIHAQSNAWINDAYQPHANMIKSTTSAMAAIAGGCDSLTINPEDDNQDTMRRIAINVSSILREESLFSKVADPTAGSYYIDSLTDQLSEKAWRKFQLLMK